MVSLYILLSLKIIRKSFASAGNIKCPFYMTGKLRSTNTCNNRMSCPCSTVIVQKTLVGAWTIEDTCLICF